MRERQNVILGAGLAGMAAAYTLQLSGRDGWQVYEREDRPGGLARTMKIGGYSFDYGPHILFTIDKEMESLIRDLLGDNFHDQDRRAYIYHHAHDLYTEFPFQAHLAGLPTQVVKDCLVGLIRAVETQARGEFHPTNYENWMRGFFGEGIAQHLMIPYARKVWTIEPDGMDYSWIGGRVPTPDVERIVEGALSRDVERVGATAKFWYPKVGGIEPLPAALSERVENIHLNRTVERIEFPEKQVVFTDGEVVAFDHMVLTFPICFLSQFVTNLPPAVKQAADSLQFIGTCCVNLGIKRPDISDKHWVYFYEDIFPFNRLSFPSTFSPDTVPPGCSSISTEGSYSETRPLDRDKVVEQTIAALQAAKILRPDDDIELAHIEEIRPSYVIFDLDYHRNVGIIHDWLKDNGIWPAGRFGAWNYYNMDHSMRSGTQAAEEIIALDEAGGQARRSTSKA